MAALNNSQKKQWAQTLYLRENLTQLEIAERVGVSRVTVSKWVRDGKCRTTLAPTSRNAELLGLVARAEKWLATNTYTNPIIKWETKQWGEIPADFGRKG